MPEEFLEQAQDDATRLAIRDMEQAGIDIISDGESRRESYSNRFANALEGIDLAHPAQGLSRRGQPDVLPRVTGPLKRRGPVQVRDVEFLRANTDRPIKITVPGPFTMSQQAVDNHYDDERCMALDFAAAVNQELQDLAAAGADVGADRRALPPGPRGAGPALRGRGHQLRAGGRAGGHRAAYLLWLRRNGQGQAR